MYFLWWTVAAAAAAAAGNSHCSNQEYNWCLTCVCVCVSSKLIPGCLSLTFVRVAVGGSANWLNVKHWWWRLIKLKSAFKCCHTHTKTVKLTTEVLCRLSTNAEAATTNPEQREFKTKQTKNRNGWKRGQWCVLSMTLMLLLILLLLLNLWSWWWRFYCGCGCDGS